MHKEKNIGSGFFKQGIVYWLGRMGARAIGFLLLPIYTGYILPDDWGILSLLMISGDLAVLLVSVQLPLAMYRFWANASSDLEKKRLAGLSFSAQLIFSSIVFLPLYIFAGSIADFMNISGFVNYIRVLLLTEQIAMLLNLIQAEMRLRDESKLYAILDMLLPFIQASFNIILIVFFNMGIKGILIGQVCAFILIFSLVMPRFLKRVEIHFDINILKKLLRYSLPLVPSAIAMAAIHNVDRYFLQAYLGSTVVGVYSIGYKFGTLMNILIVGPFLLLWEPKSFELIKRADASIKVGQIFSYYFALLCFMLVGLSGTSKEIIHIMTDNAYWNSYIVIPYVAIAYLLFGLDAIGRIGLLFEKKTTLLMINILIVFIVNIIGNIIFIRLFGMKGAAISTIIAFGLLFILDIYTARKYFKIYFQWRRLLVVCITSLILFGIMATINFTNTWYSAFNKSLFMLTYPVLLVLFGFFQKAEIKQFLKKTHSKLRKYR